MSFNSEGFIGPDDMVELLGRYGKLDVLQTRYNAFPANSRSAHLIASFRLVHPDG